MSLERSKMYDDIRWWVDNAPDFILGTGKEHEYYRKGYYYALSRVCHELEFTYLEEDCIRRAQ